MTVHATEYQDDFNIDIDEYQCGEYVATYRIYCVNTDELNEMEDYTCDDWAACIRRNTGNCKAFTDLNKL